MSDDLLDIEINGRALKARKGSMIIEAADDAGILIPRFCYHKKLSIAANCRMCLVEVEKAPKPLPACATPVMEGMKISTCSPFAVQAQKSVMEFLLINHPLDCPICDQGGECELQDVAMGYGRDVSRFSERKRVVRDKDLGSLVATDMTRCIHCTRCVRFGEEVAGLPELGGTGRGEDLEIGTYVNHALESELSGNIIDVCPVGALTSKPFRFRARAWEVTQADSVSPHDGVGSNLHVHHKSGKVVRVVPRENEDINEVWISDRDRFSYEGLYTDDRLTTPVIKQGEAWVEADWESALGFAAEGLSRVRDAAGADALAALVSPSATVEEAYLTQKLLRGLGSNNVDHRLRQVDVSDQAELPAMPWLGQTLAELESSDVILLVGTDCRREQPLVNHRIRKSVRAGGRVMVINPVDFEFNFEVEQSVVVDLSAMVSTLAGVAKALGVDAAVLNSVQPDDTQRELAERLAAGERVSIVLGALAASHPYAAALRALAGMIAQKSEARFGYLHEGANVAGAALAGAVPHRSAGGHAVSSPGISAAELQPGQVRGLLLLGIEPEHDCYDPVVARQLCDDADFMVVLTTHDSPAMREYADVLLPMAPYTENEGTLVNLEGRWQRFSAVVPGLGDARPAWRLLRVLGNYLELDDFDYVDIDSVSAAVQQVAGEPPENVGACKTPESLPGAADGLSRIGNLPIYAVDPLVRRASALQRTVHATEAGIRIHPELAERLTLSDGDQAVAHQNGSSATYTVSIDDAVAPGCVHLPSGLANTVGLGASFGDIRIEKR